MPLDEREFPAGLRNGPGTVCSGPFRVLERSVSAGTDPFFEKHPILVNLELLGATKGLKASGSDKTERRWHGRGRMRTMRWRARRSRASRAGTRGALEELHSLYAPGVFAFVSARLGDRGAAEEAAVDVWLGCWRSAAGVPGRQPGAHVAAGHRKAPGMHAHAADPAGGASARRGLDAAGRRSWRPVGRAHGAGGNRRDHGRLGRASGERWPRRCGLPGCTSFRMRRSRR